MAFKSVSLNFGNSSTPNAPVPAVAANDLALMFVEIDSTSAVFQAADFTAAGFTLLDTGATANDGQRMAIGYRRCTGSESGSWTLGDVGATGDWVCNVELHDGRHLTNPPVASAATTVDPAAADTVNYSVAGLTALAGDDLVMAILADIALSVPVFNLTVPPSGYTGRINQSQAWCGCGVASKDNDAGGAMGPLTGTYTTSSSTNAYVGWVIRIPAAAGGGGGDLSVGTIGEPVIGGSTF